MDFSTIRDRCAFRFGDESHNVITDAQWKDYVNEAYRDVQMTRHDWPFMSIKTSNVTITAGSRTPTSGMPTGQANVRAVFNATDSILVRPLQGPVQHLRLYPDQNERGPVQHYRWQGKLLEVYPLPEANTTLIIEGQLPLTDLSANADLPDFASHFHTVLVEYALAKAYRDDDNHAQADKHQAAGDAVVAAMVEFYLNDQDDSYPQIVDTFFA